MKSKKSKKRRMPDLSIFKNRNLQVILFAFVIIALTATYIKPVYIGSVIGLFGEETQTKTWDFSNPANYTFNSEIINTSNNEAKLTANIETKTFFNKTIAQSIITSAVYKDDDKTEKAQTLDGQTIDIKKNNMLTIAFNIALDNDDILSLYIENNKDTTIYLCNPTCTENYGFTPLNNNAGWHNITINSLPSTTTNFGIKVDDTTNGKVKIDQITATHNATTTYSITNTTYPPSGEIEFPIFTPENIGTWQTFSASSTLNSQAINYSYSTDNTTWLKIEPEESLSAINSTSISFKAKLFSNLTETPILYNISAAYLPTNNNTNNQTNNTNNTNNNTNETNGNQTNNNTNSNETGNNTTNNTNGTGNTTNETITTTTTTTILSGSPQTDRVQNRRSASPITPTPAPATPLPSISQTPAPELTPSPASTPQPESSPQSESESPASTTPTSQQLITGLTSGVRTIAGNVVANIQGPNRLIISLLYFAVIWINMGLGYYLYLIYIYKAKK